MVVMLCAEHYVKDMQHLFELQCLFVLQRALSKMEMSCFGLAGICAHIHQHTSENVKNGTVLVLFICSITILLESFQQNKVCGSNAAEKRTSKVSQWEKEKQLEVLDLQN